MTCHPVPGFRLEYTPGIINDLPSSPGFILEYTPGIINDLPSSPGFRLEYTPGIITVDVMAGELYTYIDSNKSVGGE